MRDLSRLLDPGSVAVIGGGAWCSAMIQQLQSMGYAGAIWPVHPSRSEMCGLATYTSIAKLPAPPDAAFVGINRDASVEAIEQLARIGAGGAVCFASGFAEVVDGDDVTARLLKAAGAMPVLGPNCYGFANALDKVALWPDQHGLLPVASGVAILTQSSNIAINLTMQARGLPIGLVITSGNQAQLSQAAIALALLDDPRVTAIGLHIEGFGCIRDWEVLARKAADRGVPLVAVKVGQSAEARAATVTHTASLAGEDAASDALLRRLGIARVDDLAVFVEALKLAHAVGHMASDRIATVSCSGGEASLAADLAQSHRLTFPPLTSRQTTALSATLGPKVHLSNPLDYHTYIWRDTEAMARVFAAACDPALALTLLIVDFPRADRCDPADWDCAINAAIAARRQTGLPLAMVASLPELMPETVGATLMAAGIVPLCGLDAGLAAVAAMKRPKTPELHASIWQGVQTNGRIVPEAEAKQVLAQYGVAIPKNAKREDAQHLTPPLVLKGTGFAHKSEAGAVRLGLTAQTLPDAMTDMNADGYLIEEMVTDAVAELLIGVTLDPTCGYLLTLGTGGVLTEIWDDTVQLLLPTTPEAVTAAIQHLKTAPLLQGYRGKAAANIDTIVQTVLAVQTYVGDRAGRLQEVEINPLICTPTAAIAADALIRIADD